MIEEQKVNYMNYNVEYFLKASSDMGICLDDLQVQSFLKFYEMLVEKNKVMNLTAITEFDEVIEKHFLDSISLCRVFDVHSHQKVLDLGTGAGFPGIPLKIAFPELDITLVDSLNKRVGFLNEVISELSLKNIQAIHSRAEDLGRNPKHREQYDLCVSRAVANLSSLSEYCLPFVKVNGQFISYKGGDCEEEVNASKNAISKLGGKISKVDNFTMGENSRSFVVIQKVSSTKKNYPRKAGTPTKDPL